MRSACLPGACAIIAGDREVTPDTALRLGRALDTTP
jgi:plasmid maintenance system antidote protein VapI